MKCGHFKPSDLVNTDVKNVTHCLVPVNESLVASPCNQFFLSLWWLYNFFRARKQRSYFSNPQQLFLILQLIIWFTVAWERKSGQCCCISVKSISLFPLSTTSHGPHSFIRCRTELTNSTKVITKEKPFHSKPALKKVDSLLSFSIAQTKQNFRLYLHFLTKQQHNK